MADEIVVVTSPAVSRRDLIYTIIDQNGAVVNLTGGSVTMVGRSSDLPAITLSVAANLTTPLQGIVTVPSLGGIITQAQLTAAAIREATFRLRMKYIDSNTKTDYGPVFELKWVQDPTIL